MSMIINFFAVPDSLTRQVDERKASILDLAKYTQRVYHLDDEESLFGNKKSPRVTLLNFKEPLELSYYPTFSMLETVYNRAFVTDTEIPIVGWQPFTDEENEILLNDYVTYAGGFLTFEDVKDLEERLSKLTFDDLLKKIGGNDFSKKQEVCATIKKALGFSEQEMIDELSSIREYYKEFCDYIEKLVHIENEERLGLFITID